MLSCLIFPPLRCQLVKIYKSRFVLSHTAESCLFAWKNLKSVLPPQKNRLIFALHHAPRRLFFLLVNKPSSVLSLCNALVLHVWSGSRDIALWNWILHGAAGKGGKILEWDMSVARGRILNLELWGWDAPGRCSESPFLSHQTTPETCARWGSLSPLKSANGLKIGALRDLVWVECFGQKQHSCPFLKSCFLKCWWLFYFL